MLFSIRNHYLITFSAIALRVEFRNSIDCALPSATHFNGLPGKDVKKHFSYLFSCFPIIKSNFSGLLGSMSIQCIQAKIKEIFYFINEGVQNNFNQEE